MNSVEGARQLQKLLPKLMTVPEILFKLFFFLLPAMPASSAPDCLASKGVRRLSGIKWETKGDKAKHVILGWLTLAEGIISLPQLVFSAGLSRIPLQPLSFC